MILDSELLYSIIRVGKIELESLIVSFEISCIYRMVTFSLHDWYANINSKGVADCK